MSNEVQKDEGGMFHRTTIDDSMMKESLDINWEALYERAYAELGLQQTKRDQIITLYLAMFYFLVPFALSLSGFEWRVKGFMFLAATIIGVLFSFIIIRYRVYKEVYWLCCQSLTVMFGIEPRALKKGVIQTVFHDVLCKKGKSFCKTDEDGNYHLDSLLYVKKNVFSAESIYFFIHVFITALTLGLSLALIIETTVYIRICVGVLAGLILFVLLSILYFQHCIKVYGVLKDGKNSSLNYAFSKAWFLHLYR